jgi:hypothetical protein
MANTITVTSTKRGKQQFQGAFDEMWRVAGTIDDQDAVALTTIGEFDVTVSGVALGDMVLGIAVNKDLDDGTDQCSMAAHVSAANTVTVQLLADNAEFAADDLNTSTIKMLIARPGWV